MLEKPVGLTTLSLMASSFTPTTETPEEREVNRRRTTAKRIRVMSAIFIVAVLARVFIKNPPPPKAPDYSKFDIRYVPGMLDAIPASERAKMDPRILARIKKVDEDGRAGKLASTALPSAVSKTHYKASETPLPSQAQAEAERQFEYTYAKLRKEKIHQMEEMEIRNTTKTTVIEFSRGGHIYAEQAKESNRVCEIRFDRRMRASIPSSLVHNVRTNAAGWTPPLPQGTVQIKPARGITIVVNKQIAARITAPRLPLQ